MSRHEEAVEKAAKPRLKLDTPAQKADANEALPALMIAGLMGSERSAELAMQIVGQTMADALRPSVDAVHRLARNQRRG